MSNFKKLMSPMKIGDLEIKNRVVMPAMCLGHGQFDGNPTKQLISYYEERAKGGVGLIIPGITRVNDTHGFSSFGQLSASKDSNIPHLKKLADQIHKHGAKIFIQLHHPGYQNINLLVGLGPVAYTCNKFIPNFKKIFYGMAPAAKKIAEKGICLSAASPSKVEPCDFNNTKNRALSNKEIKKLIKQFIASADRVKQAGMDGVEIHAAHGYLLNEFLCPRTNNRTDEYGGSFENRMRILKEIIEGIKTKCGKSFPISVRISADEFYSEIGRKGIGYNINEGVKIAKELESYGIDVLNVSGGTYETINYIIEPVTFDEGWRTKYIKAVKDAVSIPVIAVNLIRNPQFAEDLLEKGIQDFVGLGRGSIADPYWTKKAKENRVSDIKRCICCLYCFESMYENAFKGENGECSVNPAMGNEEEFNSLKKDGKGRTVVIVGAGPAGLTAAEILGRRGFKPVVLEKNSCVGGQLNLANKPPQKEKIGWCFEDLENAVKKYGGEIILNHVATSDSIKKYKPYAVIIATGGISLKPRSIKGVSLKNVSTVAEILDGSIKLTGKKVAVIGSGPTGLETSEKLISDGNKIMVVEMADSISPVTYIQHKRDIIPKLKNHNTEFYPGHKLCEIKPEGVILENVKNNETKLFKCNHVVLSLGVRPINNLYKELENDFIRLYKIGDAKEIGRIASATRSAYETAMNL